MKKNRFIGTTVLFFISVFLFLVSGPTVLLAAETGKTAASDCEEIACSDVPAEKSKAGLEANEIISAEKLRQEQRKSALSNFFSKRKKLVIFDARSKKSYEKGHIPSAVLPMTDDYYEKQELFSKGSIKTAPDRVAAIAEGTKKYPKDTPIVTYCGEGCQASVVLLFDLKHLGFSNIRVMEEGLQKWQEKGYPIAKSRR